jgi:hypothetical protein
MFNRARFGKKVLISYCDDYVAAMVKKHGFDTDNGTSQVKNKTMPIKLDYAWMSLTKDLSFDLNDGVIPREGRFNREAVLNWLDNRMTCATQKYKFDHNNGWAQVEHAPTERQFAYADWIAAANLARFLQE